MAHGHRWTLMLFLAGLLRNIVASWAFASLYRRNELDRYHARDQHASALVQPIECLDPAVSSSLEQSIDCLDAYTVSSGRYSRPTYDAAQPNAVERLAWRNVISSLLDTNSECLSTAIPAPLIDIYAISLLVEPSNASYCILSELHGKGTQYAKGWGTFVVPAGQGLKSRHIHISAPHPAFDLNTPVQAASLFKSTHAKSLLIAGRSREALMEPTDCIPSTAADIYLETDPAHNNEEPFFDAVRSISAWQTANGGCPDTSCAYIQLHGKGSSTCSSDQIFLSAGLGADAAARAWYTDSVPRPVKRLKHELKVVFPAWNISLPTDSSCTLTATKNVVGRFLNGVPTELVCSTSSEPSLASGFFIHAEQSIAARGSEALEGWSKALINTFQIGE